MRASDKKDKMLKITCSNFLIRARGYIGQMFFKMRNKKDKTNTKIQVAQAEMAALLAKAAALKQRHALEQKEEHLIKEKEKIRRQKETQTLESELSATNVKLAVLTAVEE